MAASDPTAPRPATKEPAAGDAAPPGRVARLWEAGRIGSPSAGAAWTRAVVMLLYTLAGAAAATLVWSHADYAGPWATLDLVPPVLVAAVGVTAVVYWMHGSMGQAFLYLSAVLLAICVGGFALGNAVFAVRGVVSPAVVAGCVKHDNVRQQWYECRVGLPDGTELGRSIRAESPLPDGRHVTVSYDPGGFVAPAFGHRRPSLVTTGISGGGLAVGLLCVVAAAWTGERLRTSGRQSSAQRPNPRYYPRRIAWQNEHTHHA